MPLQLPSKKKVAAVLARWASLGGPDACTVTELAKDVGIARTTVHSYLGVHAERYNLAVPQKGTTLPSSTKDTAEAELKHRIKTLETQLSGYRKGELSDKYVRSKILGLADTVASPPTWLVDAKATKSSPGVPTLMASDWHWAEVVNPTQIGGVNEYNLDIAHARAKRLITTAIDLLNNHMVNPQYPGIVFVLGGDLLSGDIHDELKETNEIPLIKAMLDLFDVLVWCIATLANTFGRVFVPCVTGNHGRNTMKIRAKDRNYTSFDWLVCTLLEKHFATDKRVTFLVSDGPDAYYKVYNHRYLLSHGDQFRGGDGMIGALGPIIRGDYKKRSRNNQVNMGYDTLIIGHWHQLIQMNRLIVNGSLCGYNEYAYAGNFPFETPKQALWVTHPVHGITFSIPVHVGEPVTTEKSAWVSVK